jgi:hypothetical protein
MESFLEALVMVEANALLDLAEVNALRGKINRLITGLNQSQQQAIIDDPTAQDYTTLESNRSTSSASASPFRSPSRSLLSSHWGQSRSLSSQYSRQRSQEQTPFSPVGSPRGPLSLLATAAAAVSDPQLDISQLTSPEGLSPGPSPLRAAAYFDSSMPLAQLSSNPQVRRNHC